MADENEQLDTGSTGTDSQVQDTSTPTNDEGGALLDKFMEQTDGPKGDRRQTADPQQTQRPQQSQDQRPPQPRQEPRESQEVRQVPAAKRQYGQLFYADQRGDIYNAEGRLVAKQGYGRTVFHQLYPYIEALTTENASFKQRFDNYERANEVAKRSGLTLDDYGAAMQLMVSWKKDKLETLKTLLNIAQETGTDISSLRGGGGIDPAALRATMEELLDSRLTRFDPIVANLQREREAQEENEAVMTQYHAFMEEFPDAGPHQGAIARVMRDHNYTPREAYFALRSVATQHGLDWSRDLAPQLDTVAKASNGQNPPPGSGQNRALPQMTGGRNGASVAAAAGGIGGTGEESWDHILRKTFEQHGIKL